jgi:hypothetical protein
MNQQRADELWTSVFELFDRKSLAKAQRDVVSQPTGAKGLVKSFLGRIADFEIVFVNGHEVGVKRSMDFIEGGNGFRYHFIPKSEIWLDAFLHLSQLPFIAVHELIESEIMATGVGYDKAHAQANDYEREYRRAALRKEWP